jgi:hypothetical protein
MGHQVPQANLRRPRVEPTARSPSAVRQPSAAGRAKAAPRRTPPTARERLAIGTAVSM